jgi:trigger factor
MDLEVSKKKLKETKVKLSVEIPVKIFEEFKKEALDKLAKQVEVKGFRKGKVPVKVAKKHLEEEKIDQEALQMALPEVYSKVVLDEKIKPVGQPKVEIKQFEENKPVKVDYTVDLLPEIKLPDYKKLKVKKESSELTEKDIEEGMEGLKKRLSDYEEKEGKIEKGDWVEIDFEGTIKGAKSDQLSSKNHPFIVGEGGFVPGFEKEIIGMKKGQKKSFKLKLPKDHPEKELAGEEVKFEVKINEVKLVKEPTLDEVAKKMGVKDKKELKEKFKEAQENQKEKEVEKKYEQDLVTSLVNKAEFGVPDALVEQELSRISAQQDQQLAQQGMTKEQYFENYKIDEKEYQEKLKESAEQNVKVALVLNTLAQEEDINPKKAELKKKTEEMISQGMMQGGDKNELRDQYESDQGQNYVENILRNEQTLKRLKKLNKKDKKKSKKKNKK